MKIHALANFFLQLPYLKSVTKPSPAQLKQLIPQATPPPQLRHLLDLFQPLLSLFTKSFKKSIELIIERMRMIFKKINLPNFER